MRRSNCLFFAVTLAARRWWKGDPVHFSFRPSYWGRFPHFLVSRRRADGSFRSVSYKPIDPKQKKCPPPLFRGHVVWGDDPPEGWVRRGRA